MKSVVYSMLALALTGLPAGADAKIIEASKQADKQVYISIGSDVLKQLNKNDVASLGLRQAVSDKQKNSGYTLMAINQSQVAQLSHLIHQDFVRCPGFFLHESLNEAQQFHQQSKTQQKKAAVDYTINNAETAYALLGEVSGDLMETTVASLSEFHNRYFSAMSGIEASKWIKNRWTDIAVNRSDISVELYEHDNWAQPSVIATIVGTESPDEIVVIGGHLDSINGSSPSSGRAPGADDNASGIAVLTETLNAIVTSNYRPAKTLKIMGYAAEEVGLRGSQDIASEYKNDGKNVLGVAQFDMTGFHGKPTSDITLINDHTSETQNAFMVSLMDTYLPDLAYTFSPCGYACSDHASWNHYGFPASFPFEAPFSSYNQTIHTTEDLAFNAEHAVKFLKLSLVYVSELAKGAVSDSPIQMTGNVSFSQSAISVDEGEDITFTIDRLAGQDAAISIDFATEDGTAVAGTDYTANSGTLSWADQENGSKSVTISTADVSENKTFKVVLSNPQGGTDLGSINTLEITIVNKTVVTPTEPTEPAPPVSVNSGGGGALSLSWLGLMLSGLGGAVARRNKR